VATSGDAFATAEALGEREKGALDEVSAKQDATGDGIKKYVDIKTENRQVRRSGPSVARPNTPAGLT